MNVTSIDRPVNAAVAPQPVPAVPQVGNSAAQRVPGAVPGGIAASGAAQSEAVSTASLEKAAARMDEYARGVGRSLQFRVDQDSGRVVVSVRDLSTGELIRQIPSEAALKIAQDLSSGEAPGASLIIEGLA